MLQRLLLGLWYLLPAIFANMAPIVAAKIFQDKFDTPVDFNAKYKGKPLFGKHKTYRGFVAGVFSAILVAYFQRLWFINNITKNISLVNYEMLNPYLWGFLMGFGALFGDLVKSFIKRRLKKNPGKSWIPFDQWDFILGAILFTSPFYFLPLDIILYALLLGPITTIGVSHIGYYTGFRKEKF